MKRHEKKATKNTFPSWCGGGCVAKKLGIAVILQLRLFYMCEYSNLEMCIQTAETTQLFLQRWTLTLLYVK